MRCSTATTPSCRASCWSPRPPTSCSTCSPTPPMCSSTPGCGDERRRPRPTARDGRQPGPPRAPPALAAAHRGLGARRRRGDDPARARGAARRAVRPGADELVARAKGAERVALVRNGRGRARPPLARDLGGARLARGGRDLGVDRGRHRRAARHARRLRRRFRRRADQPHRRRDARLSVPDPRNRARRLPRAQPPPRDDRHRHRGDAGVRPPRARAGAGGEGGGLRRSGARGRQPAAAHPRAAHPPEHPAAGDRAGDARDRRGDHRGSGALVPRARPAAAGAELGLDAQHRAAVPDAGAVAGGVPRARDLRDRARVQPARRRPARRARSAQPLMLGECCAPKRACASGQYRRLIAGTSHGGDPGVRQSSPTLPPGPKAPPAWQSLRFLTRPLDFFQEQVSAHGETFTIRLAGLPAIVMLTAPADLKSLFTAPTDVLHAGEVNAMAFAPVVGNRTHFVLDEESHLERRRLMLPPFHGERMHEYGETMAEVTSRAGASWPRERPFPVHPELQRIALQVILRTVFGLDEATPRDERVIRRLVRLANEAFASPLLMAPPLQWDLGPWSPWGHVLRVVRDADHFLLAEIRRRREEGDAAQRKDILSMLLVARNEDGDGLTDAEVRDELATMVLAGQETTGTALSWALECPLRRPDVVRRIREEIVGVAGEGDVPRGREQLAKREYLDATIREVLRFRPIMAFGGTRIAKAPWRLREWEIPAGTAVATALSMLHRRP